MSFEFPQKLFCNEAKFSQWLKNKFVPGDLGKKGEGIQDKDEYKEEGEVGEREGGEEMAQKHFLYPRTGLGDIEKCSPSILKELCLCIFMIDSWYMLFI